MPGPKHSRFPPSTLSRVLSCRGSFALEAAQPSRENFFTDEGHAAHKLAEWALRDGFFDTRAYLGRIIAFKQNTGTPQEKVLKFTVDEEMCVAVQAYVDAVKNRLDAFKAMDTVQSVTLEVEKKIDTSSVLGQPAQSGTIDTLILVAYKDGTGFATVEDLKYGAGVPVTAKDNIQLMTYAAAVIENYKDLGITEVMTVIHQPRIAGGGHVSEERLSAGKLAALSVTLRTAVTEALEQETLYKQKGVEALELTPGESQCRFCKARRLCPAFNAAAAQKKAADANLRKNTPKNDNGRPKNV